jgi:hypothetical protein
LIENPLFKKKDKEVLGNIGELLSKAEKKYEEIGWYIIS